MLTSTNFRLLTVAAAIATQAAPATKRQELLGQKPALGWNSWNVGQCRFGNAQAARDAANQFLNLGLYDLGYEYINIDDCWQLMDRDGNGNLVPDPSKFPNGMKAIADEIHEKGMKFGLYGSAGTRTCANYPASEGHELQDAQALASWTVDYWKYDNCYTPCQQQPVPQTCGNPPGNSSAWYTPMEDALASVDYEIFFSLCNWGRDEVWKWGMGQSWRISGDNFGGWNYVVSIASLAADIWEYAKPGGFNDLDMMQIGNGHLTENEERTHMGIWAMAKSPILLGMDLTRIAESALKIVSNAAVIAVNQDELGVAATYFQPQGAPGPVRGQLYPYWAGPLSDGVVIGLVASGSGNQQLSFNFADVPGLEGEGPFEWTELWTGTTGSDSAISTNIAEHDMRMYKVVTSGQKTADRSAPADPQPAGV